MRCPVDLRGLPQGMDAEVHHPLPLRLLLELHLANCAAQQQRVIHVQRLQFLRSIQWRAASFSILPERRLALAKRG